MTDNNQLSNPNTAEPKYRKKLNTEQIAVLELLYRFRFASSKQIGTYQQKRGDKAVQKRLKILEDQGLISKRYDKSYKLKGKPAAYYLLPAGARMLETNTDRKPDEPINFKRIYKDKDVSEGFIEHCLNILTANLTLQAPYPSKGTFRYFTKSQLNYEKYDFFPNPLPDAYIRLKTDGGENQFFLDIFEETQPYFVLVRRIKKYLKYSSEEDWRRTKTDLPTILIACANTSVQKRLRRRIAKELRDSYEDNVIFATTTIEALKDATKTNGKVWLPIDEDGDNPDEPWEPIGLEDF